MPGAEARARFCVPGLPSSFLLESPEIELNAEHNSCFWLSDKVVFADIASIFAESLFVNDFVKSPLSVANLVAKSVASAPLEAKDATDFSIEALMLGGRPGIRRNAAVVASMSFRVALSCVVGEVSEHEPSGKS